MALVDVTLTTLVYGGDALGRLPDGRAILVPFGLPGETVRVRIREEKRGHVRADLVDVLTPAPERIAPRCVHFGICGGCQYQHLPYEAQVAAKTLIFKDQLERIGKLTNPAVEDCIPSPKPYYYRNYNQFHLTEEGKLGYHRADGQGVFAIQECHLPEAAINVVWPQLSFEDVEDVERIGLRQGSGEDMQLMLESSTYEAPELSVEELDLSVVHLSEAGALVLAGSEWIVMTVLEREFRVSAGSFFQVNLPVAEAMITHLLEHLERLGGLGSQAQILDVYCGAGLFSAFLAPKAGRLIGIEESPSAVDDFVANLDEFDHVEVYEARAEDALPQLNLQPQAIVVDPPRAGLDPRVLDALVALHPQVLAYISCDPATLARDARRLVAAGYRLEQATPFDLFPQTAHIESISFWLPVK